MSANYNDGSIPYGSQVVTLMASTTHTTGTTYIADNIEFSDPSKEILRTNQIDEPSGSVDYSDFSRATSTLQMATTSTPLPSKGSVASLSRAGGTSAFYRVFDVTEPQSKDAARVINVTWKKIIN